MEKILSVEQSTISSQDLPKYGYLYITTNLINNKKYIGIHKSSCFDESYKGSGKILHRAIDKYGWENFKTEILKWCYSKEELYQAEIDEINARDAVSSSEYYNVMPGGHGGDNKSTLTEEEYQEYVRKVLEAKSNRPRTEKEQEQLDRIHESRIGTHMSEESKIKSRESNLGQIRSDEARKNMSDNHADFNGEKNPYYGKHHSDETREKIGAASRGKIWVTNKLDLEVLIVPSEFETWVSKGFVRGRLRKSQKK